jgi:phage terminase large subunit GpA-like protein
MAEYQSEPLSELTGSADDVTAEQVMKHLNNHPRGIVPLGCEHITLAVDIQKSLLYYTVIAWGQDFTGHVLTYGTWPDQKQLYFTTAQARHTIQKVLPAGDLESQLYGALQELVPRLMETEWPRDDGTVFKISKGLIDSGWGQSANTIHRWVRQSRYQGLILPSVGKYIGASGNPMSAWAKHPGDKTGLNYRIRSMEGRKAVRSVLFDSNWYKSFLHNRLRVPPGGKSGLALFGDKPEIHRLFADHLTKSEYRVVVEAKNASGRICEEWKTRPERTVENHWLDCCALNCVGAMILGVVLEESGRRIQEAPKRVSFRAIAQAHQAPAPAPAPTGRVSFRDLQQKHRDQAPPRR